MKYYLLFFIMIAPGCKSNSTDSQKVSGSDTTAIVNACFVGEDMRRDLKELQKNADTIYLLKTNLYNKTWPQKIGSDRILYIQDTDSARHLNYPWAKYQDTRLRYKVEKLKIQQDSASIKIFLYNAFIHYNFKLQKKDRHWEIVEKSVLIE
jgi:hypothetical protein